jgi:hypothetical protein
VAGFLIATCPVAGEDNRLDLQDLSFRHNLSVDECGLSPPKVRSAKKILGCR